MPRYPIVPKDRQDLLDIATPDSSNQPEAISHIAFDTQPIVSTTTINLPFFTAVNADKTLSNMDAAASFPDPQFMEIWYFGLDFLFPSVTSVAAVTGNLNDLQVLLNAQRAILEISISNKKLPEYPAAMIHGIGGPMGANSGVIATSQQAAMNGVQDGGLWAGGQIVLPPKVNFTVTLRFAAAPTINATPLNTRVSMIGVLHRRVL